MMIRDTYLSRMPSEAATDLFDRLSPVVSQRLRAHLAAQQQTTSAKCAPAPRAGGARRGVTWAAAGAAGREAGAPRRAAPASVPQRRGRRAEPRAAASGPAAACADAPATSVVTAAPTTLDAVRSDAPGPAPADEAGAADGGAEASPGPRAHPPHPIALSPPAAPPQTAAPQSAPSAAPLLGRDARGLLPVIGSEGARLLREMRELESASRGAAAQSRQLKELGRYVVISERGRAKAETEVARLQKLAHAQGVALLSSARRASAMRRAFEEQRTALEREAAKSRQLERGLRAVVRAKERDSHSVERAQIAQASDILRAELEYESAQEFQFLTASNVSNVD